MKQFIMALDQGTTSSRCVLYDEQGAIVTMAQKEFGQIFPADGWVEHDPMEIWESQLAVAKDALAKAGCGPEAIAAIGITNQRETTILWDKNTGRPIYNAIVWQCRRTAAFCDEIGDAERVAMIKEKTGLVLDPYFSGTKIRWILDHVEGAWAKAEAGELLFGTVETWLIWNLSGGKLHITDHSNAARTMLFNIHTKTWDEELLQLFAIPSCILPTPVENSMVYGYTEESIFGAPIPLAGAAGDQQAALFGQLCFEKKEGKMTYGTGGFMLLNTGTEPIVSGNGLLSTIGWTLNGETKYAMEGSVFVEGAVMQWLRDEMGLLKTTPESEELAGSVEDTGGVYIVPAFTGLGAPYWDPYARGTICGITRGTNRAHFVRAALESMAYQTVDLAMAMHEDLADRKGQGDPAEGTDKGLTIGQDGPQEGTPLALFKVDGGASANDFLMQFQADVLGVDVIRPKVVETTSLGAAYLAGLAVGYWKDTDSLKSNESIDRVFIPSMTGEKRGQLLKDWHRAVDKATGWSGPQ